TGEIASQEVRKDPRQPGADVLVDIGRVLTTRHPIDDFYLGDLGRGDSPMDRLPLRLSLCVPATRSQPALLAEVARATASSPAAAFDPILLAGWLAETYQLPLSQAAIEARGEAVQRARREHGGWFRGRESYDTSGLIVEDFKLLLIPLWIGGLQVKSGASPVCLHGVTGQVFAGLG
ncbi:MAG: hypothetical protein MUO23_11580, partial [Anaerolineales bacterium]|nr:hypothetical protein [Anaerolineales bacterium]